MIRFPTSNRYRRGKSSDESLLQFTKLVFMKQSIPNRQAERRDCLPYCKW